MVSAVQKYFSSPKGATLTAIGSVIPTALNTYFGPLSWAAIGAASIGGQFLSHGANWAAEQCLSCFRKYHQLNQGLKNWCKAKEGTDEHADRLKIARKIRKSYVCATYKELKLDHRELTSLPSEIGNLSNLLILDLSNNQLPSLPPTMGNLSNLRFLNLSNNQLASLPPTIGNLSNLRFLGLYDNQLASLPFTIGNLSNLQKLFLYNNKLTSLPLTIGNLSNLQMLILFNNPLASLPLTIGNLQNLKLFRVLNTQLTEIPPGLFQLPITCTVELNGCPLSDETLLTIHDRISAPGYAGPQITHEKLPLSAKLRNSILASLASRLLALGLVAANTPTAPASSLQRLVRNRLYEPRVITTLINPYLK